ncbi:MAG: SH3 domain-containing protein [Peptococcaceae bacterium]|nr:SH3 domain-containing protein [Peptococcaceae bacterium]
MTGIKTTPKIVRVLAALSAAGLIALSLPGTAPAATRIVVKQAGIDLFQGPGTGYSIAGTAGQGDTLVVLAQKGAWTEVRTSGGQSGWIPGVLVTLDGRSAAPPPALPPAVTPTVAAVNVRSGPGTGYSILTTASQGDYLVVQGRSGQWYEVLTPDGVLGWIAGWYTRPAAGHPVPAPDPAGPGQLAVSQPQLTLFGGPGTGDGIVGSVPQGTVLTILDTVGGWTKVQPSSGTAGWIPSVIVTQDQNPGREASRGQTPVVPAGAPYRGKGEWSDIYSKLPRAGDLSAMAADGVTHIYLEVATSQSGFTPQWQGWLNTLLPAAHRAGIKVIAWVYVTLANPAQDAQLTSQVANYVTPLGDRPDGVAADIETLPKNNPVAASQLVTAYASLTRSKLPAGMPFIAITFPPQYRPSYPFAAFAAGFNAIALMDYWHITTNNYTYDDTKSFVAQSLAMTRSLAGTSVPLEVILQGYDNGTGMPTAPEMQGALAGSAGAAGYSVYTWDSALGTAAGDVFNTYR